MADRNEVSTRRMARVVGVVAGVFLWIMSRGMMENPDRPRYPGGQVASRHFMRLFDISSWPHWTKT